MPDTDRYREWAAMLAASDGVLVQLVFLAAVAVLGWEVLRRLAEPWRGRARRLYLALGLGVLLTTMAGQVSTLALVVAAVVIGAGAGGARVLFAQRGRRLAAPLMPDKGEN